MKRKFGFFVGLLIVAGLIRFAPSIIAEVVDPILSIGIILALWVLTLVIGMGLIKISLKLYDDEKVAFFDLFSCFPLVFKYLFGSILYRLIILGGTILLIVPGIIWGIKYQFFSYFIVDKGLGPIEALKRSSAITTGAKWDLFLFGLLLGAINLL